jgi:Protein of unknown function (DUF3307)
MAWVEIFAVFFVSHLVGDYLLQTDWQARNKPGGLGGDPLARRALVSHIVSYTLAFVPALIWLADDIGAAEAVGIAGLIAIPHLIQDDGRALGAYVRRIKGRSALEERSVLAAADQSFHVVALFLTALLAGS